MVIPVGSRVQIRGTEQVGTVSKVRPDPAATEAEIKFQGGVIYTVELEDKTFTSDGLYYAREAELYWLS